MLYSITSISKDSSYEVYELDDKTVVFFTETGIEYIVGFVEDDSLGLSDTYQIYLTKKQSDKVIGSDPKIGKTITAIVRSFFGNRKNILTYICDINDKHQAARDRKFKIWFHRYASIDEFEHLSDEIMVDDCTYYMAVIASKENENLEEVRSHFRDKVEDLRSKLL